MKQHTFSVASELEVPVDAFLQTLTMLGVNAELYPWLRMTAPPDWLNRPIQQWPEQQHLFASWILWLGIVPVDRHQFYFTSIDPQRGFAERSSSLVNSCWRHTRQITETQSGSNVFDEVAYQSRLPLLGYLLKPIYRRVFATRHRHIRSKYGGCSSHARSGSN